MTYLTRQPLKGVYALGALGFELVRTPLYLVKYLISSGRQHPTWTFRQAIVVRIFFSALFHVATLQIQTPLPLTPNEEKERFVVIKPAKDDAYRGPLRSNPDVVPAEIGATWYPAPLTTGSDIKNVKVVLLTHGGAFVAGKLGESRFEEILLTLAQETEERKPAVTWRKNSWNIRPLHTYSRHNIDSPRSPPRRRRTLFLHHLKTP